MAWTQADLDKLKEAVASGVLSVRYDGPPARSITYQDLREMRALLAEMTRDVAGAGVKTHRYATTNKGFGGGGTNWGNNE